MPTEKIVGQTKDTGFQVGVRKNHSSPAAGRMGIYFFTRNGC